jgi:hypothetical protein
MTFLVVPFGGFYYFATRDFTGAIVRFEHYRSHSFAQSLADRLNGSIRELMLSA